MKVRQRRRFERAPARFPIWVKCANTGKSLQGHTANVSVGGMFLLTAADCDFSLGAEVSVVFGIRDEGHGGYVLHEAVKGAEVVRLERHGYGTGMALKFIEARICRCAQEPTRAWDGFASSASRGVFYEA